MQFYELAVGAPFFHRGERFVKIGMSVASGPDGRDWCWVFMGFYEVEPDGVPLLLPPEEAAKWKPDDSFWTRCAREIGEKAETE